MSRKNREHAFSVYQDGHIQHLVAEVRDALERAGMDQSAYCGHSFRIATAVKQGMEDAFIRTMEEPDYVKNAQEQLATYYSRPC